MVPVVLVHGWGYDASLWDAVRAELDPALDVATLDPDYLTEKTGAGATALAVGHSLGALWWLTQTGWSWRRLLCINGFPRFTATPDYAPAVPSRVLARMRVRFAAEPASVLAEFHARCGSSAPPGATDQARLAAGLAALADRDGRGTLTRRRADIFALAGDADPIVPAEMSLQAFAVLPEGHLAFAATPGHLLPLTDPALCARWIERLAA